VLPAPKGTYQGHVRVDVAMRKLISVHRDRDKRLCSSGTTRTTPTSFWMTSFGPTSDFCLPRSRHTFLSKFFPSQLQECWVLACGTVCAPARRFRWENAAAGLRYRHNQAYGKTRFRWRQLRVLLF
jgi:hypothetical protein